MYLITFPVSSKSKTENWCWDLPDLKISARTAIMKISIVRNLAVTLVWSGCDSKSSTQSLIDVMTRYSRTRWRERQHFSLFWKNIKFPNEMPQSFLCSHMKEFPSMKLTFQTSLISLSPCLYFGSRVLYPLPLKGILHLYLKILFLRITNNIAPYYRPE